MDVRIADENTQLRESIDRAMSRMNTCIPGIIQSFDAATQTVEVLPAIKMRTVIDDIISHQDHPVIIYVPLVFPHVANFGITFPVAAGDECLLVFSQRAIDNWHDLGGVQPPDSNAIGCRHHDLTDAFAILAPASVPNVFGAWNTNDLEIRNRSHTTIITVKNNGEVNITAPTSVTITSPTVHITGDLNVDGDITDGIRSMAGDRAIYNQHTHPGDSGGTTGVPNQQE